MMFSFTTGESKGSMENLDAREMNRNLNIQLQKQRR